MNILLNRQTAKELDGFIERSSHAIGIFGPTGSGKSTVAIYIANNLIGEDYSINRPNLHIVQPEQKNSITINQAREIISFLKLKNNYGLSKKRVVIIDDAHLMTHEAQNAILKILEEPPFDTTIIITALNKTLLLPTIISRLESTNIRQISKEKVDNYFCSSYPQTSIDKAWSISGGRLGLFVAILSNQNHELLSSIDQAKELITKQRFQRLIAIDDIIKQNVLQFLEALQLVSDTGFKQATKKDDLARIKQWHKIRKSTSTAISNIHNHAQTKLVLTDLLLTI